MRRLTPSDLAIISALSHGSSSSTILAKAAGTTDRTVRRLLEKRPELFELAATGPQGQRVWVLSSAGRAKLPIVQARLSA